MESFLGILKFGDMAEHFSVSAFGVSRRVTQQRQISHVPGSKLPLFPYNRDGHQPNSRGPYIPIIRIPIKDGMSLSPTKRDF